MIAGDRFYLGHLGKTPVYIVPEAAFSLLLIWTWSGGSWTVFLTLLMAYLTVVLIHESGHALSARTNGMANISITVSALGGYCSYLGNPGPRAQLPISLAGPGANLLTAAVVWLISRHVPQFELLDPLIQYYVDAVMVLSLVLGIFNLLPIYPLDGGQATLAVARMVASSETNARRFTLSLTMAMVPLALIAMYQFNLGVGLWTYFILAMLLFSAFRDLR